MLSVVRRRLGPNARIRVLIVDDSVVIRRLIAHALEQDSQFEIVGYAANGLLALGMIARFKPDAITLDIEMPEMDGLTTVRELRKINSETVVVMFSTLSTRGASVTLDALSSGANDYVAKPSNVGSLEKSRDVLQQELLPKLKQFFDFGESAVTNGRTAVVSDAVKGFNLSSTCGAMHRPRLGVNFSPEIVAIGVSTGGPNALAELIPMIPADFPIPIVIVQHMPPVFTRLLADRLQDRCNLRIQEATHGMPIEKGNIYLAPGDYHMRAKVEKGRGILALDQEPLENSCRPAVDVLFRSIAESYRGNTIAIILTGMGRDGERGVEVLRSHGAYVIAQDEASSVVWGMPGAVVRAGLADAVLDLKAIIPEVRKRLYTRN